MQVYLKRTSLGIAAFALRRMWGQTELALLRSYSDEEGRKDDGAECCRCRGQTSFALISLQGNDLQPALILHLTFGYQG